MRLYDSAWPAKPSSSEPSWQYFKVGGGCIRAASEAAARCQRQLGLNLNDPQGEHAREQQYWIPRRNQLHGLL